MTEPSLPELQAERDRLYAQLSTAASSSGLTLARTGAVRH